MSKAVKKLKITKIIIGILTFRLSIRKIRCLIKIAKIIDAINDDIRKFYLIENIKKDDIVIALRFMKHYTTYPDVCFSLTLKLMGR